MRRSRRRVYNSAQEAMEYCRKGKDKDGFIKRFVDVTIGFGLFTTKQFSKGEFLLEYVGEHISSEEGQKREDNYPESMGNYLFFFGKEKCVDATHYPNRLCRFVNDSPGNQANSVMKMVTVDGMQHLCLFALKDIGRDTELRYDYGVKNLPWRNQLVTKDSSSHLPVGASEREVSIMKKKIGDVDNMSTVEESVTENEASRKESDTNMNRHNESINVLIETDGPETTLVPCETHQEVLVLEKNSDVDESCSNTMRETSEENEAGTTILDKNKDRHELPVDILIETPRPDTSPRNCKTNQDDTRPNICSSMSCSDTSYMELKETGGVPEIATEGKVPVLEQKNCVVDELDTITSMETPTENGELGTKILDKNKDGYEVPVDILTETPRPDASPRNCETNQDKPRSNICSSMSSSDTSNIELKETGGVPEIATEGTVPVLEQNNCVVDELDTITTMKPTENEELGTKILDKNKDGYEVPVDIFTETPRPDASPRNYETNQDESRPNTCSSMSRSDTSNIELKETGGVPEIATEGTVPVLEQNNCVVDELDTITTMKPTENEELGTKILDKNKDGYEVPVDIFTETPRPDASPRNCETNQDKSRPNICPSMSRSDTSNIELKETGGVPEIATEGKVPVLEQKNCVVDELDTITTMETPTENEELGTKILDKNKDGYEVPVDILIETPRPDASPRNCETNQDKPRSNISSSMSHSDTFSNELNAPIEVVLNLSDCVNEREVLVLEKKSSDVEELTSNTIKETLRPAESETGAIKIYLSEDGHEVPVDLLIESYGPDATPGSCCEAEQDSARPGTSVSPSGSAGGSSINKSGECPIPSSSSFGLPNFKKAMMQLRPKRNYPQYREDEEHVSDSCDSDSDANDPSYMHRYLGSSDGGESSDSEPSVQTHSIDSTTGCVNDRKTDAESISDAELGTEQGNTVLHSKKPRRRCPFCDVHQTNLSRHIRLKHKNLKEVADAIAAPEEERAKLFNGFKKEGILKENQDQAKLENPQYQQEKKSRTGSGKLVMCSNCRGFYHTKFIFRHRKLCLTDSCETSVSVPLSLLSKIDESNYADEYLKDILCKLRDDDIGKIAKKDPVIVMVGKRMYMKNKVKADKRNEVRKCVMTSMRRLAALYVAFNGAEEELGPCKREEGTSADMFKRCNYNHLEKAVITCTLKGDGKSTDDLKHGLKSALYYLVKRACTILKGTYLIDEEDSKAEDVDKFLKVFELNHDFLFGDAAYAMAKKRNETLRRPAEMPIEEDVRKVREYTISRMTEITKDSYSFLDYHLFVELRDLLVCRLTLFNARRGGEPSRLRLTEWLDAENDVWIDPDEIEKLDDPLDKALAGKMKIAYQTGKGNKHLVPVLIPPDTVEPMKMIAKKESRDAAEILESNPYMFPSTQQSHFHVSGWHAVHNVTEKITLEKGYLLTATKNRHRVSTMYAVMDIPEGERRYFYEHMGHSKEINADIYQAPLALMELVKVGRSLKQIDGPDCDNHEEDWDSPSSSMNKQCQITQGPDNDDDEEDLDSPSPVTRKHQITEEFLLCLDNDDHEDWDSPPSSSMSRKRQITQEFLLGPDNDDHEDWDSPPSSSMSRKRQITQGSEKDHEEDRDSPPSMIKRQVTQDNTTLSVKKKKDRKYIKWNKKEEAMVLSYFQDFIMNKESKKLPGRKDIQRFLKKTPEIGQQYTWMTIRTKVMNEKVKRAKHCKERLSSMQVT